MKNKILSILLSSKDYVSGQALAEELGVSRQAVWKGVNALKESGYEIASTPNKGYKLVSPPEFLNAEAIKNELHTEVIGREVIVLDSVDSTNDYLKELGNNGCREGVFYRKEITTGVQAFRYGMQHFVDVIRAQDHPIFISLSIAPIFPYGYGHARRISCDAFGTIDQTEYLNNCITWLWWMNDRLYRFNDPDHIVVFRTIDKPTITFDEGKSRYHSGVICGSLMITSDDARIPEARERVRKILTNEGINALARRGQSFVPASPVQGGDSCDVFVRRDGNTLAVALFNYSISEEKHFRLDIRSLWQAAEAAGQTAHSGPAVSPEGISSLSPAAQSGSFRVYDFWTKTETKAEDSFLDRVLKPAESAMLRISLSGESD